MNQPETTQKADAAAPTTAAKTTAKASAGKRTSAKKSKKSATGERSRTPRIYPSLSFEDSIVLGESIHQFASGEKVSRLTLLKKMDKSPTSSAIHTLIISSTKYGLTKGSYVAEYLELTEIGKVATDPAAPPRDKLAARFKLAVEGIPTFKLLYDKYKSKRLPAHEVLSDALKEGGYDIPDPKECIDFFIVNAKFLGLLQTIAGSETLVPVEAVLEELPATGGTGGNGKASLASLAGQTGTGTIADAGASKPKWTNTCFYITPIGDENTEHRKHSDLFLNSIVEPALKGFGLDVIRADKIGEPGMITSQILEHILYARLVIVDLSYHNPNVFYEMAVRHMCKLPVIQISRKADKIPFDVNQVRTITIDTTDIYSLLPKIETYKSEISTHVRSALDGQTTSNPISVFFPKLELLIPKL